MPVTKVEKYEQPTTETFVYFTVNNIAKHYGTIRKVAGSIPDDVTRIFLSHIPFARAMNLGSTQHLKEMSIRNISWGVKAAGE